MLASGGLPRSYLMYVVWVVPCCTLLLPWSTLRLLIGALCSRLRPAPAWVEPWMNETCILERASWWTTCSFAREVPARDSDSLAPHPQHPVLVKLWTFDETLMKLRVCWTVCLTTLWWNYDETLRLMIICVWWNSDDTLKLWQSCQCCRARLFIY